MHTVAHFINFTKKHALSRDPQVQDFLGRIPGFWDLDDPIYLINGSVIRKGTTEAQGAIQILDYLIEVYIDDFAPDLTLKQFLYFRRRNMRYFTQAFGPSHMMYQERILRWYAQGPCKEMPMNEGLDLDFHPGNRKPSQKGLTLYRRYIRKALMVYIAHKVPPK